MGRHDLSLVTDGEVFREIFLHDYLTRFDRFFEMSQFHVLSAFIVNVSSKLVQLALQFRHCQAELSDSDFHCLAILCLPLVVRYWCRSVNAGNTLQQLIGTTHLMVVRYWCRSVNAGNTLQQLIGTTHLMVVRYWCRSVNAGNTLQQLIGTTHLMVVRYWCRSVNAGNTLQQLIGTTHLMVLCYWCRSINAGNTLQQLIGTTHLMVVCYCTYSTFDDVTYDVILPLGWAGSIFLAQNGSCIYPNMCTKFGCGPTVVSKKRGGYRQTDRQTDKDFCSFI